MHALGRGVTAAQAKRLDVLGLSRQALIDIREGAATAEEFKSVLLERGVRSRPLREKLVVIVSK